MSKSNTNPVLNKNAEIESHSILTKIGGLIFKIQKTFNSKKSSMVRDDSFIGLTDNHDSKINLSAGGHVLVQAGSNLTLASGTHGNISIKGDLQQVVGGDHVDYVKGDKKSLTGLQGDKQKAAYSGYQDSINNIQQARLSAYNNTQGEMVACPVCSTTHLVDHNGAQIVDLIFKWLYDNVPYFPFETDIQKFFEVIFAPLTLSPTKNIGLSGSKGCGSPGCVNGMIESPAAKMKAADTASAQHIDLEKENLNKYSIDMGVGGGNVIPVATDLHYKVGIKKNTTPAYAKDGNHVIAFALKKSKTTGADLYVSSEGSTKRITHHSPTVGFGSAIFDVANKFTVNAGTPGIDLLTGGRFHALAGDIIINATEGEAILASGNVTTVKGKNIILDAQDYSGDSGVSIQSAQTMVTGGFSVKGNAAFKGHVTLDGSLSVPHLICPTMRQKTTARSSSKFITEGANWLESAAITANGNLTKDLLAKYITSDVRNTSLGITSLAMESYNILMTNKLIEGRPTGVFFSTVGFPCAGLIFNFVHNHTLAGHDHNHDYSGPLQSTWQTREGWGGERQDAGPVPMPPPPYGDTVSPGPFSKPGGCGGGGLYTKNRNENYGLNVDDPYFFNDQQNNYVPLSITRTSDGTSYTINNTGNGTSPQFSRVYGVPALTAVLCQPNNLS